MAELGLEVARSGYAYSVEDALAIVERTGYPCVLRPRDVYKRQGQYHRRCPVRCGHGEPVCGDGELRGRQAERQRRFCQSR